MSQSILYRAERRGDRLRLTPVQAGQSVFVAFSDQNTQLTEGRLSSREAWGRGLWPVAVFAKPIAGNLAQFDAIYYRTSDRQATGTLPQYLDRLTNLLPGEELEHGQPAGICPVLPVEIA